MEGAGADVWGTADAFRFVYRSFTGDVRITARVASVEAVDAWTKAGVMIRSTLQPDSPHAFMLVSPGKGLAFQRRNATGGATLHTTGGPGIAPSWVRLERRGQIVTASTSVDGASWTVVGEASIALNSSAYIGLAVSSHRSGVLAAAVFDPIEVVAVPRLPAGWSHADVGAVGAPGTATEAGGTFNVLGAGADVWGTADAFHYVYRALANDGEVIAQVSTVESVQAWTKAGIMLRQSLQPGAPHAFAMVTAGKGIAFQRRRTAGGFSSHTSGGVGRAPRWLKLTRQGQLVSAYHSADGVAWTLIDSDTLNLTGTIYVGLAVSSHDATTPAGVTFTHVSIR
jgi:regulation of enolase protein 1 (concanavalin A-like superfamily)